MLYQDGGNTSVAAVHHNNNEEQELHALFKEIQKANQAPRMISASLFFVVCILLIVTVTGFIFTLSLFLFFTDPCPKPGEQNPYYYLANYCSGSNLKPINEFEYSQRRLRLMSQLKAQNVPAIVMEPGPSMLYFTSVSWSRSERAFLFIAAQNGQMAFVTPAFEKGTAMERIKFFDKGNVTILTWQENESPFALVNKFLLVNELALQIAVEPEMRNFLVECIAAQQIQVLAGTGKSIIRSLRMVKSEAELKILDCANRATKAALNALYTANVFRVGASESYISEQLNLALKTAGLTNIWMLVLGGSNAAFPHGTSRQHTLVDGDFLLIDTGGEMLGYQSDISRTFLIQSPVMDSSTRALNVNAQEETRKLLAKNETRIQAWNLVREAQNAALRLVKPGVTCAQVAEAARKVIVDGGYGPMYAYFTHRLGHGIGIQGHEDPYLVESNSDTVLQEGMTFSIEPGIYVMGDFGVRLEDIVQVTSTGYKVFGNMAKSVEQPID